MSDQHRVHAPWQGQALRIAAQPLPGVRLIHLPQHNDHRGSLLKTFCRSWFVEPGRIFQPAEHFVTCSGKGVLRGMHYYANSPDNLKLVTCISGSVLDVVVDTRPDSPHFNQPFSLIIDAAKPLGILVSGGYAHGFLSLEENSTLSYLVNEEHDPSRDQGVHWQSIDYSWPTVQPLVSSRDASLPSIHAAR